MQHSWLEDIMVQDALLPGLQHLLQALSPAQQRKQMLTDLLGEVSA